MPDFSEDIEIRLWPRPPYGNLAKIDGRFHWLHPVAKHRYQTLFNPVSRKPSRDSLHLRISRIELGHIARKGKSMVRQVATIPQIF